mmetsp:Transcript_23529/g.53699  ORF Transcript_23529/g.53699 Transcript_23529/m.53699 type:complete len:740 (-) Transcript_23529:722-2941(-)|eukprot:CAMPEP_0113302316 /NCGR_PEP_ID=MMETSP0010_2-20120614/3174_1 /TAXON_ID=216773 ORGANISM="Corethron hystrix, Strain 308" /NCGR_SAMPLE_ID=MMETSP0010_2 /ASSEMBLY_ACC=CAM_ASM_000155 /LENGTH=739 /DNA_ID=CAMNT_0000156075 /DNA_START=72 /DNA_END=2291 /DNA_ORIENTATION=+ /assembly_acc=CAM_ASM_000155
MSRCVYVDDDAPASACLGKGPQYCHRRALSASSDSTVRIENFDSNTITMPPIFTVTKTSQQLISDVAKYAGDRVDLTDNNDVDDVYDVGIFDDVNKTIVVTSNSNGGAKLESSESFSSLDSEGISLPKYDDITPTMLSRPERDTYYRSVSSISSIGLEATEKPELRDYERHLVVGGEITPLLPIDNCYTLKTSVATFNFDDVGKENTDNPDYEVETKAKSGCSIFVLSEMVQSILLGLAFALVWSPNNLMAPNLTAIAEDFEFTPKERDVYLGAYVNLATGVLSIPIMALIGIASDFTSHRVRLYSITIAFGGLSSIATGLSESYTSLYWCRFVCGGCMCGCVPVAYSLLGDLFEDGQRNAASSGLAACMGAGMLIGQVYAGKVGPEVGWEYPFISCGRVCLVAAVIIAVLVHEPVRGGKEGALREIVEKGGQYEKRLDWDGFLSAMTNNRSNFILILQGFFVSVPWGIIFCFLNDYLSQERHLSVADATYLVGIFGAGCAAGGIGGGYLGQLCYEFDKRFLIIFMSITTFLGILPMLALINHEFSHASLVPCIYAFFGGCIANLPSVNVRPLIINVNPPEIRGAALTAANLLISLARGIGPSFMTSLVGVFKADRQESFNILIISFWVITALLLIALVWTVPADQRKMEEGLREYVILKTSPGGSMVSLSEYVDGDEDSLITIPPTEVESVTLNLNSKESQSIRYLLKERIAGDGGHGVEVVRLNSQFLGSDYAFHMV